MVWMVDKSLKVGIGVGKVGFFFYLVRGLMFLLVFCRGSKSLLCYLDGVELGAVGNILV